MKFHVKRQSLLLTLKVLYLIGGDKQVDQPNSQPQMKCRHVFAT